VTVVQSASNWPVWTIVLPLVGAALAFLWQRRARAVGTLTALFTAAAVVALLLRVADGGVLRYPIGGWGAPLGIDLHADGLAAFMLAVTAAVGIGVTLHGRGYFTRPGAALHFWPLWLLLWAALNALFLSSDIFNLFVTMELVGFSSVALVALAGGGAALTGAVRYLLVSLTGSTGYLLGVALLYGQYGTLDILELGTRLQPGTLTWVALGLMFAGLALKTALFPMHFWLPGAHGAAPAPVSALLSGLVVKASFYLLLRLWQLLPEPGLVWGQLLGLLGAAAILWGSLQALRQQRLKMLLAYSTVAQIGYLFLLFPLSAARSAWLGVLLFIASHALAKSAMFLCAGNILLRQGHDRVRDLDAVAQRDPVTLFAFGLAGVSLIGLPPSGGFAAKWLLLQAAVESGQWWWVLVMAAGALMAAVYVFRVLGHAFTPGSSRERPGVVGGGMNAAALLLALGAIAVGFLAISIDTLQQVGPALGGGP